MPTPPSWRGDTPQPGATTTRTSESWTPRAPRAIEVRASAVARRRVPNRRGASRKRRQKGDGGMFGPAVAPIIDAPQASAITAAKPRSPLQLIPRTSRQPRVVQGVRLDVAPPTRESRSDAGFRGQDGETRTRTGDTTIFSRGPESSNSRESPAIRRLRVIDRRLRDVRKLRSFAARFGTEMRRSA
jgi:hypothetical protein